MAVWSAVARRHREAQHLAHSLGINAEASRSLALAQAFNAACVANPRVQIHRLHPTRPAADLKAERYERDGILLRRSRLPHPAGPVRDLLSADLTRPRHRHRHPLDLAARPA